jgi:broad specificity phosphatase PhoE
VRRLLLIRHAPTRATRTFAFPADEPLEAGGAIALAVPARFAVLCSPSLRCLQTAEAAGLEVTATDPRIAECDFGDWAGRTLAEIPADAAAAWMADPDAAPHGGESLRAFAARVAGWLDEQAVLDGGAAAITHGGVIKAAVVHALGAPLEAFWRIDAAPLAVTELHAHDGRWTLTRANAAPARGATPTEAAPLAATPTGAAPLGATPSGDTAARGSTEAVA